MTHERERPAMKLPDRQEISAFGRGHYCAASALEHPPSASLADRPVRLVVGFPAGGGADAAARIIAQRFSEVWGQRA